MGKSPRSIHIHVPPFLPKQLMFIYSKNRYTCYSGGVGSGKTYAGCHKGLKLSLEYKNNVGLIGTQTYRQLMDTTQKTFFEICNHALIKKYYKSDKMVELINGSLILFRTLDDESKLRSLELGWFFIDEIVTVQEPVFKQLKKRLRLNVPQQRGFGATNPAHPNHWVYRHFAKGETDNTEIVYTSSYDNPFLPKDYIKDLESIKDPDEFERFVQGKWIHFEGLIYKEFQRSSHLLPSDWEPKFNQWEFYRSIDFGYINPFVCLFITVDKDNCIYVFDEHYGSEVMIEQHFQAINNKYTKQYFHKTYYDPSDPESAEKLRRLGLKGLSPANHDVAPGIQHVKEFLSIYHKKPLLKIHPRCVNLINEFESYCWDKDKRLEYSGDYKEQPKKDNDHCLDALRYFIHTRFYGKRIK